MNRTLSYENLIQIKKAMDKIAPIDQSDYFKNYYKEILWRLNSKVKDHERMN